MEEAGLKATTIVILYAMLATAARAEPTYLSCKGTQWGQGPDRYPAALSFVIDNGYVDGGTVGGAIKSVAEQKITFEGESYVEEPSYFWNSQESVKRKVCTTGAIDLPTGVMTISTLFRACGPDLDGPPPGGHYVVHAYNLVCSNSATRPAVPAPVAKVINLHCVTYVRQGEEMWDLRINTADSTFYMTNFKFGTQGPMLARITSDEVTANDGQNYWRVNLTGRAAYRAEYWSPKVLPGQPSVLPNRHITYTCSKKVP
jgi:hypothetical protein